MPSSHLYFETLDFLLSVNALSKWDENVSWILELRRCIWWASQMKQDTLIAWITYDNLTLSMKCAPLLFKVHWVKSVLLLLWVLTFNAWLHWWHTRFFLTTKVTSMCVYITVPMKDPEICSFKAPFTKRYTVCYSHVQSALATHFTQKQITNALDFDVGFIHHLNRLYC